MSRVALDVPPELLLTAAVILPLGSIALVYTLKLLGRLVPLKKNIFSSPTDGLDPVPYVHSGQRSWKHWLLALLAGAQAAVWAVFAIWTGVAGKSNTWEWAVGYGLVSLGWVSWSRWSCQSWRVRGMRLDGLAGSPDRAGGERRG